MMISEVSVVDVGDLVLRDAVAQDQPAVLAQREADPRLEADVGLVEGLLVENCRVAIVDVEAGEQVAVEERRLDEAELEVAELGVRRHRCAHRLAAAEEVALGDRHLRGQALVGGEGAAEAEAAGRLLLDLDRDQRPVRRRAVAHLHRRGLEIAEAADAVLGRRGSRGR